MITPYTTYMFRFKLPDGWHIATHKCTIRPKNEDEVKELFKSIAGPIMINPDAEIDFNSVRVVTDPAQIDKAVAELKAENPERILGHELGLDVTNRLLTNPEVARTIAAAQSPDAQLNP